MNIKISQSLPNKKQIFYPLDKNSDLFKKFELHRDYFTYIKPEEFLTLALPKAHIRECSINYLFDAFELNEPLLDPVSLSVSGEQESLGQILSHEGRHRAEISKDLGIEEIPIIFHIPLVAITDYDIVREYNKKVRDDGYEYDRLLEYETNISKPKYLEIKNLIPQQLGAIKTPDLNLLIQKKHEMRLKYGIGNYENEFIISYLQQKITDFTNSEEYKEFKDYINGKKHNFKNRKNRNEFLIKLEELLYDILKFFPTPIPPQTLRKAHYLKEWELDYDKISDAEVKHILYINNILNQIFEDIMKDKTKLVLSSGIYRLIQKCERKSD